LAASRAPGSKEKDFGMLFVKDSTIQQKVPEHGGRFCQRHQMKERPETGAQVPI